MRHPSTSPAQALSTCLSPHVHALSPSPGRPYIPAVCARARALPRPEPVYLHVTPRARARPRPRATLHHRHENNNNPEPALGPLLRTDYAIFTPYPKTIPLLTPSHSHD